MNLTNKPASTAFELPGTVLWDMDGTLIDQTESIIRCYSEVISEMGYTIPDAYAIKRSLGGPLSATLAQFLPEEKVEPAKIRFKALFPEYMFEGMVILPGAMELIKKLNELKVQQAIITNKQGENARRVMKQTGFDAFIQVCVGNGDNSYAKPDCLFTQSVTDQLEAPLGHVVLIGDSPTDVATALNSGYICYAVTTGSHSMSELKEAGAAQVFSSISEIIKYWAL